MLPYLVRLQLSKSGFPHTAAEGLVFPVVPLASAVRQTAVMPRDGKGGTALIQLGTFYGPGGGVVNLWPSVQPALECGGILSQVVGQPSKPPLILCTKSRGKVSAQFSCPVQVL